MGTGLKVGGEITTVLVSAIACGALGLFIGQYAGFDHSYLLAALSAAVGAVAVILSARGRR